MFCCVGFLSLLAFVAVSCGAVGGLATFFLVHVIVVDCCVEVSFLLSEMLFSVIRVWGPFQGPFSGTEMRTTRCNPTVGLHVVVPTFGLECGHPTGTVLRSVIEAFFELRMRPAFWSACGCWLISS